MKKITSQESPLRVDFLPADAATWPGRVGITIAPGKRYPGIEGLWERDLDVDLARLREEYGASVLVPLCEEDELARLGIGDLVVRSEAAGLSVLAFPFPDGGVPESTAAATAVLARIAEAARRGETVVIHCRGGLGRSGTLAACLLVREGHRADAAIAIVRRARTGAIENAVQEGFVRAFASDPAVRGAAPA